MGAEPVRRQRGPRRRRVPEGAQRGRPRPRAGRDLGGRGVDRLAGRLAADVPGRARLRLQVEHGLDARHAGVLPARPDLPPLAPPRADVQPRLRVHRELHPAARRTTRSCTARARCCPRCRATAGRSSRTCARCTPSCGRTPARSCCSWASEFAQEPEWSEERSLDWHLLENPQHARHPVAGARPQPRLQGRAGAVGDATSTTRASGGSRPTTPTTTCSRSRAVGRRTPSAWSCSSPTSRRCRARATGSGCRARAAGARSSTPTPASTAARTSATWAASRPRPDRLAEPAVLGRDHAAAARRALAGAGRRLTAVPCGVAVGRFQVDTVSCGSAGAAALIRDEAADGRGAAARPPSGSYPMP